MTDAQIAAIVKEYLPQALLALLSIMSTGVLVGVRFILGRQAQLFKAMEANAKSNAVEHAKIRENVMGVRAELHMENQRIETIKGGLLGMEGAVREQSRRLDEHIKAMGKVEGKLEAVFKYIDAQSPGCVPKRATDVR